MTSSCWEDDDGFVDFVNAMVIRWFVHRLFSFAEATENSFSLTQIFTLRWQFRLCHRHRAKLLISIGNLHTRDRMTQRIMRDRMRLMRCARGAGKAGAGVGHWGVAALSYSEKYTEQVF